MIDDILDTLRSDIVEEQAFKLTGIRGTGKTVALTAIGKQLKEDPDWIVVDLKSNGAILTKKHPVTSASVALSQILKEVQRKNKRLLITIDEIRKTDDIVDFIQEFQLLIRNEFPVYLIVAGLYEDIDAVENADGLTFFLRAKRCEMAPLSINLIREDYKTTLGLSSEMADTLAHMTKGYAFAYQAFGKYMWDSGEKTITPVVLAQVDEALSEMVYQKIWSELSPRDRWFLSFIVQKDHMSVSELLEITKKKHHEWSEPRKHLIEKGLVDGSVRGEISLKLPRLREFVENVSEN